ncbi:MAG: nucleoside hydrolase [Myxococcota bacterium]|nr:nucleoside hydrolase [Myxococcota bacterium]
MRVWIDTDVGTDVDDALALAYVLRQPSLELVGVSTVFGDVSLRTRIARALLASGDAPEVPVVTGLGAPLSPGRPGRMFGHEGVGLLEAPAPLRRVDSDPDAAGTTAALAAALEGARPDVVLAIGPLTNLGALVRAGVSLPRLAIMGGKLRDVMWPGMVAQVSEWNWYCDPTAVQAVLAAPAPQPPRVVPAEVTFGTRLAGADVARLADGDGLARALHDLCRVWLDFQREKLGAEEPEVLLHDPLTAATLVEPGLCSFEERRIRVDDEGASTDAPDSTPLEVAADVDNDALCRHLMRAWRPD